MFSLYLANSPNQRDHKSQRLVNALGCDDCPCILTFAPSQRDVKIKRLVNALDLGVFPVFWQVLQVNATTKVSA